MLYISEGCQPANRVFYVDLSALSRTPSGSIDFLAYDFFKKGGKRAPCQ
jgi:prolyl oligopeptidase